MEWSRIVFTACRDWPLARMGHWFRSAEGWLRLRIDEFEGEPLEPLFAVELDTANEEANLDFGSWGTPIFRSGVPPRVSAERAVAQARKLIDGWLEGAIMLASYSDKTGWRGSKLIYGGPLPDAIEPVPVAIGEGATVIVKTAWREGWRSWCRTHDSIWKELDVNET